MKKFFTEKSFNMLHVILIIVVGNLVSSCTERFVFEVKQEVVAKEAK